MKNQITRLLYAAGEGDVEQVRELVQSGVSINAQNENGYTPLMSACRSYRTDIVEFLLRAGANTDACMQDGETALHAAVRSTPSLPDKQRDCVRLLLKYGAQVNPKSASGITPLMHAAWFGCTLALIELLNSGADPSILNSKGQTALDVARMKKRDDIVNMLK